MSRVKILLIALFCVAFSANTFAQNQISPERKRAIYSLAIEKIRDLSKYITIVGSKETPFSEANRVIERTLELFADDSQIGVSSLYRS